MGFNNSTYIKLILLHILLGILVFYFPFLSKIITILLFFIFIGFIVKSKNKNNEALIFAAYIVAGEVFFRMTNGVPNNEYGKYSVIIFLFIGSFYSSISNKSHIYWLFILFLIPGIFVGIYSLNLDVDIRKAITFNISGPVCLAIASVYAYKKKVNSIEIEKIITIMIFPIVSMVSYMYLYTPTNRDIFTGTESNFVTSGGFGPNQVSTILGLGMFVVFVRLILFSKSFFSIGLNLLLFFYFSYRGIITFSRGGIYTAIIMILSILIMLYFISNLKGKFKINLIMVVSILIGIIIFTYSSLQTDGMIDKRYSGQDGRGREKSSKFSGREKLVESELMMFIENPILGVGVGVNKQYREELTGVESASHNEISRMLAEHGLFGIINMLILLITPLIIYFQNKQNIFVLSFYLFWLLTINHASMRLAAPAFIYALSLLNVSFVDLKIKPLNTIKHD